MCQKRNLLQTKLRRRQMIVIAIGEKEFQNRNLLEEGMFMFHLTNQILHLMKNTFQIRQCEERRCRSPKYMYVKRRKIRSWKKVKLKVKTLTVTVSLKTTKLANDSSHSQQKRRDKGKSIKPKIVSSKLTNRKSIPSQRQSC